MLTLLFTEWTLVSLLSGVTILGIKIILEADSPVASRVEALDSAVG